MKQKDLAIIIAAVFLSAIVSYILATKLITTPADRQQQVQVVPAISSSFPQPDPTYFNAQAYDPIQLIHISGSTTPAQFSSGGQ
jgi:hypothetical protein